MRVVVTGAAGLLGRAVAAACAAAGHDVRALDRVTPPDGPWERATADLADLGAAAQLVAGAEAVVHCAAIPRPTGRAPAEIFTVNLGSVYAVVEAARLAGVRRFVYASSFAVLGFPFGRPLPRPAFLPIDESHPVAPLEVYGLSKWLGEEIVAATARAGAFAALSLRLPWLQSPETFAAEVGPRRGTAAAAEDLWAYLDLRDAAAAFVAALAWEGTGHQPLYVSAADTYEARPTAELLAAAFPGVELRAPLAGHAAVIDGGRAAAVLGFRPRHSWRDYATQEGLP